MSNTYSDSSATGAVSTILTQLEILELEDLSPELATFVQMFKSEMFPPGAKSRHDRVGR